MTRNHCPRLRQHRLACTAVSGTCNARHTCANCGSRPSSEQKKPAQAVSEKKSSHDQQNCVTLKAIRPHTRHVLFMISSPHSPRSSTSYGVADQVLVPQADQSRSAMMLLKRFLGFSATVLTSHHAAFFVGRQSPPSESSPCANRALPELFVYTAETQRSRSCHCF